MTFKNFIEKKFVNKMVSKILRKVSFLEFSYSFQLRQKYACKSNFFMKSISDLPHKYTEKKYIKILICVYGSYIKISSNFESFKSCMITFFLHSSLIFLEVGERTNIAFLIKSYLQLASISMKHQGRDVEFCWEF